MNQKKQGQRPQDAHSHDHTSQQGTPRITANLNQPTGQESSVDKAKDQITDAVSDVTQQASQTVGHLADQAKHQVTSQIDSQKQRASETLSSVAQALRQTSTQLHGQEQGVVADYSNKAADQVERLSGFLRDNDVNDILHEAEQFARRSPALFLGGAFALGLMGARFLKSSSQQRQTVGGYPRMYRQPVMRPGMYDQGQYSPNHTYAQTMSRQHDTRTPASDVQNQAGARSGMAYSTPDPANRSAQEAADVARLLNRAGQDNAGTTTGQKTAGTNGNNGDRAIEYGQTPRREDD